MWLLLSGLELVLIQVLLEMLLCFVIKERALMLHLICCLKLVLEARLRLSTLSMMDIVASLLVMEGLRK